MQPNTSNMEYRFLGGTGLKVSLISFGSGMFQNPKLEQITHDTVKRALELGINFFDTAEGYAAGYSETCLGLAFKKLDIKREDIVVSTKIYFGKDGGANRLGLSRKRVIEGCKASLARLQLDYVDIIFAHRYDHETPLEETCRAFDWLIRNGKAFYWGTSEWTAQQIASAIEMCDKMGLYKPVVDQVQYNLFHRERFEIEYAPLFDTYKYGTTVWSPLAGGALTGKYLKEETTEGRMINGSEFVKNIVHYHEWFAQDKIENTKKIFKEFEEIAKSLDCTIAQLSLAWVLRNKDVSTAISGYSTVTHVEENVKAVEIYKKITPEIEDKIEQLFKTRPKQGINFKSFSQFAPRR